jgi:hypothetical protein
MHAPSLHAYIVSDGCIPRTASATVVHALMVTLENELLGYSTNFCMMGDERLANSAALGEWCWEWSK